MRRDPLAEVKEVLHEGPDASRRLRQRARALDGLRPRRWSRPVLLAGALAAVALLSVLGAGLVSRPPVLENGSAVPLGRELIAEQARTLTFAEGSTVALAAGAAARVERLDASHVDVVLERGRLDAKVTKGTGRAWRYLAGGWTVRVVGTELAVTWDPSLEAIEVRVVEGVVEVSGPGVERQLVRAGEQLSRRRLAAVKPDAIDAGAEAAPLEDVSVDEAIIHEVAHPVAPPAPPKRVMSVDAGRPEWRELLAAGKRAQALEAAEQGGVFSRLDTLPDDDALALADAARLERRTELTRRLLTQVFARNGGSAAEAAFLLGRLEVDAHHPDSAALFFRRAVQLAPDGPFSEQSRGRLMEALLELDDLPAARAVATESLSHHPAGAWSGLARRVVSGDGGR